MEPVVGEKERNVRRTLELIGTAAVNGARLIVLPELCNSGYMLNSREEAFALAEEVPNGPTCRAWEEIARAHGLHIVAGMNERDGQALYNAAVVIDPSGHVGTFRKVHLWNEENLFFEPGNLGFPKAQRLRRVLMEEARAAFDGVNILATPTLPLCAWEVSQNHLQIGGQPEHVLHACWRFTYPWNLTGLPALSVPCGFADGLPVGLQLVGRPFDEAAVLRVGHVYQEATRWHEKRPADPVSQAG